MEWGRRGTTLHLRQWQFGRRNLHGTKQVNNGVKTLNDFVLGSSNFADEVVKMEYAGEMSMDQLRVWDALFDSKAMKDIYENELMYE